MIETVYIEHAVKDHPVSQEILSRLKNIRLIECDRYGEIFNRKSQNFRLQKLKPALILAEKHKQFVLETPEQYGIGSQHNYYFSHMMNCIYDCRYCFLQGMYRSANYVVFVNFDDFIDDIKRVSERHAGDSVHFFSGYDCDSLALEPITQFTSRFLPFFSSHNNTLVELRTKSTQIRTLLDQNAITNAVIAYSLTPDKIARALEHKAPTIEKRIAAMKSLQASGWQVGLRFDPLIYSSDYKELYTELFDQTFSELDTKLIHSVSLGTFRLPNTFFKTLSRLYPDEKLLASPVENDNGMVSYKQSIKEDMMGFCTELLLQHIPESKFFPCHE